MFASPPVIETDVFVHVPDALPVDGRRSILEGPSFDRGGNLYLVDIHGGQVFRVAPDRTIARVAAYDGSPNGLKIHKDGRILIADYRRGLVELDPGTGTVVSVIAAPPDGVFHGLNDLVFTDNGDLYFTDQGDTDLRDARGRVWRLNVNGSLDLLIDKVPSPNGLVLTPDEGALLLAVTRANAVWRLPLNPDGTVGRVGTFIQMSGGVGPDGMAMDEAGNLAVAHVGMGSVWLFSDLGRPLAEIRSCRGVKTTNVAYGGPERKQLFITEAESASVLVANLEIPGRAMYSHH